jgi:hypothetical protein
MAHAAANFSAVVEAFGQLYGYVSLMSFCTKTKGVKKENMLRALRNLTHHTIWFPLAVGKHSCSHLILRDDFLFINNGHPWVQLPGGKPTGCRRCKAVS